MEEKHTDLLQKHSLKFLEMAFRTDKRERLAQADGYGKRVGDCGDSVEIFLDVRDGCIDHACFDCQGCINTVACANTVVEMAEGKTLDQAWEITPEQVVEHLESLPDKETHCAEVAVGAFYLALASLRENGREPWKKLYRK